MDLKKTFSNKELKFKQRLEKILKTENLNLQRTLIEKITQELDIDPLDCAAALVCLSQSNLYQHEKSEENDNKVVAIRKYLHKIPQPKMVAYRLEIGQKHKVSSEQIKNIVVAEAGVERKMIGDVSIRYHHTFIELPEGMPADIFQLLSTTTFQQQALKIKRLRFTKNRY